MMNTMNAAPPSSDVRRLVAIDFLFVDLSSCARCVGTGANLETALSALDEVLRATGESECGGGACGCGPDAGCCG